jgi:hypothetical protein
MSFPDWTFFPPNLKATKTAHDEAGNVPLFNTAIKTRGLYNKT